MHCVHNGAQQGWAGPGRPSRADGEGFVWGGPCGEAGRRGAVCRAGRCGVRGAKWGWARQDVVGGINSWGEAGCGGEWRTWAARRGATMLCRSRWARGARGAREVREAREARGARGGAPISTPRTKP